MARKTFYKKSRRKPLRILLMAVAIVTFWWGVWGLLDSLFHIHNSVISYALGVIIAVFVLFIDDFHLRELE